MTLRFFWRGDKMQVTEKINALRKIMGDSNIDAYIIVTDDYHGSEYVGDYFKEREYMSVFQAELFWLYPLFPEDSVRLYQ